MSETRTHWICLDERALDDGSPCTFEEDRDTLRVEQGYGHLDCGEYDLHRRGSGVWVGQVPCDNCNGVGYRCLGCERGKCEGTITSCQSCGGSGTVWPDWAEDSITQLLHQTIASTAPHWALTDFGDNRTEPDARVVRAEADGILDELLVKVPFAVLDALMEAQEGDTE